MTAKTTMLEDILAEDNIIIEEEDE